MLTCLLQHWGNESGQKHLHKLFEYFKLPIWANGEYPPSKYVLKNVFCQLHCTDGKTSQEEYGNMDYSCNESCCWPEKTCRSSSTVNVRAFSISPPAGIQSPPKLLSAVPPPVCSAFLIRFPTLMHPKYFLKCIVCGVMQCIQVSSLRKSHLVRGDSHMESLVS